MPKDYVKESPEYVRAVLGESVSRGGYLMESTFTIEFWKSNCEHMFNNVYLKELVELGMSREDAIDFLESVYSAVSGEYGN